MQWDIISKQYKQFLEGIVGPLVWHSSDGDARRRKLMLEDMVRRQGNRFRPIPEENSFIYSAEKIEVDDGSYVISGLGDQDAFHQIEEFTNVIYLPARMLTLGKNYLIHVNHLLLVSKCFEKLQHGLSSVHLERKDRQNLRSAQEIIYKCVQDCIQNIIDGVDCHARDESARGILLYLQLVWMYNEIFFSSIASFTKRILYAGYIVHFLGIWRNFVHMQPPIDFKTHFITKECYLDSLLSCHFTVMLIIFIRDNYPNCECRLDLTGSDPCEVFFFD